MIRPELAARLAPWRAAAAAVALAGFGLWVASWGGLVFLPLGLGIAAVAAGWFLTEWRHLRLGGRADGPGVVELDEGAVRYYAARGIGGEVALRELAEIRVLRLNGRGHWRLRTAAGEALLIPVDAAGAAVLADAFAALPGADLGRIAAGLARASAPGGPAVISVWRSPAG